MKTKQDEIREKRGLYERKRRKRFLYLKNTNQYVQAKPKVVSINKPRTDTIMGYSLTYVGVIAMALVAWFGITQEEAATWIKVTGLIIAGLITLIGRWRKGDINFLGFRKDK